jgi:hypothetical protein
MDTLVETTKSNQDNPNASPNDVSNLTRKERKAKNLERENSKQIQKQSIRTKKSYVFIFVFCFILFDHLFSIYALKLIYIYLN